ncbi:MAG: threonine--tRNA ligase [Patescibacteria group bacterium]
MPSKKSKSIDILRHSCSHVLAQAVWQMFPEAKLGIGPTIENGFYYDFLLPRTLTPEDLKILEDKMRQIIKQNAAFEKKVVPIERALEFYSKKWDQPFKRELTEDLKKQGARAVIVYQDGKFIDLCRGPHLDSTGEITPSAFKLTRIAGAYWKGSEKRPMMQRIYGIAFASEKELKDYLQLQEKIKQYDHRETNKAQKLFGIYEQVGGGLILWHPKGAIVRQIIENFWREEHLRRGYQYVYTPHIGQLGLWKKSGHFSFYRENMYSPIKIDKVEYMLKPMNCPFHVQIYKSEMRSYRDLPIRFCELGTVYRYERAGTLHGLLRVRGFTQDDAHIFCASLQVEKEVSDVLDFAIFMLKSFGFKKFEIDLSLRDPKNKQKYLGNETVWQKAEGALETALKKKKLKYKKTLGEAVFYGPKIDLKLIDSLGRGWQGPTVQIDFNFPEKFDLNYINEKGQKEKVVMIHRTVLGSMERFFGSLLEHTGGALPTWLAPVQCIFIPVSDKFEKKIGVIVEKIKKEGLRIEIDLRNESVGKKISDAIKQKIPYMIVMGEKEIKSKKLAVRERGGKKVQKIALATFVKKLKKEIQSRS